MTVVQTPCSLDEKGELISACGCLEIEQTRGTSKYLSAVVKIIQ